MVNLSPVTELENVVASTACWTLAESCWWLHAAQLWQGLKPMLEAAALDFLTVDRTTMSFTLVGLRKATIGGSGMASLQRLEA